MLFFVLPAVCAGQWIPLGPEGGDVRSLAYDSRNPSRIFLGTSASALFVSNDDGNTWSRLGHLGDGGNYVLDNLAVDPESGTLYAAAWSAGMEGGRGDLFRSRDEGKTWQALPGMRDKSIRALQLAPSDGRTIVVGALDGVFRSRNAGDTWERISPPGDAQIKNVESIAIDPHNLDVIYAGTWHLAWKTVDGGKIWHPMRKGVIDDSDVFSIIVDFHNPSNVYLSACSGIYKSEDAGEEFRKVQGIPFSARRTRVLKQDPLEPTVIYAGTTEGLWKTADAGKSWRRISTAIIVNDVHIDPRDTRRILLATDRGGVLASSDGGQTFVLSNRGFSHRMVRSVLVDHKDVHTYYAGLLNDKEFGGVFISHDDGRTWQQANRGIYKLDVFTLTQAGNGDLLAGTNKGIFKLPRGNGEWRSINTITQDTEAETPAGQSQRRGIAVPHREAVRRELSARVWQIEASGHTWFAATAAGLYQSRDEGKSWQGGALLGHQEVRAVRAFDATVLAISPLAVLVSQDDGETWKSVPLPPFVTSVRGGAIAHDKVLWLATDDGAFRSVDDGAKWERMLSAQPIRKVRSITYDPGSNKLVAISDLGQVFVSGNGGKYWDLQETGGYLVYAAAIAGSRVVAATAFSGVIIQPVIAENDGSGR